MSGFTRGGVRILLRLEGLCVLAVALAAYARYGHGWGTFALYFLVPDLSLAAYLIGSRFAAAAYNTAHAYVGAVACAAACRTLAGRAANPSARPIFPPILDRERLLSACEPAKIWPRAAGFSSRSPKPDRLLTVGIPRPDVVFLSAGLIWCAHIGFDRALGYDLKYSEGFSSTHLGRIGRARIEQATNAARV